MLAISQAFAVDHKVNGRFVNWSAHNGTSDERSYSPLSQINRVTVRRLGLAWSLDLPDEQMLQATPLAVDGVLYFTGCHAKVYAVDAVRGTLRWTYDPQVWKHGPRTLRYILPANRGLGYDDGRLFLGATDGRLIALDAATGHELWAVKTTADDFQAITGAPRTFNGKVIIGQSGADYGSRGYVTAYDQVTGQQVWRFYVAPGSPEQNRGDAAMEKAAATWHGEFWKSGTGGGPWDSLTFDRDLNRIYVATGNAAPYDPEVRSPGGGDNLYTASIVALDADTGSYLWHYQINPRDSWDFDSAEQMSLAELMVGGKAHKVLIQAPKNGFLYVIDRNSGRLLSAGKIGKATWADHIDLDTGRAAEAPNIRYQQGPATISPSPAGAHGWHSMSFDPQTGLVYIPYMQLSMRYSKHTEATTDLGGAEMTLDMTDPQDGKGALIAYDPLHQRVSWKVQHDHFWNGGVLSSAGGLVFQGTAEGIFSAYDARSGKRLWQFDAGLGMIAAPISYCIDGVQYVSILTGYGASNMLGNIMNVGWKFNLQPRRLLTFRLDGHATPTPSPAPSFALEPLDEPSLQWSDADVAAGAALFTGHCASCHGLDVVSAGAPAPDLRESRLALDQGSFSRVVHDGALLPEGMPLFDDLSDAQVHQLYVYVRARARKALVTSGSE